MRIQGGQALIGGAWSDAAVDIDEAHGAIRAIGSETGNGRCIDARGLHVLPGLVDIHSHPSTEPFFRGVREEHGVPQMYMSGLYERFGAYTPEFEARRFSAEVAYCEMLLSGTPRSLAASRLASSLRPRDNSQRTDSGTINRISSEVTIGAAPVAATPRQPMTGSRLAEIIAANMVPSATGTTIMLETKVR